METKNGKSAQVQNDQVQVASDNPTLYLKTAVCTFPISDFPRYPASHATLGSNTRLPEAARPARRGVSSHRLLLARNHWQPRRRRVRSLLAEAADIAMANPIPDAIAQPSRLRCIRTSSARLHLRPPHTATSAPPRRDPPTAPASSTNLVAGDTSWSFMLAQRVTSRIIGRPIGLRAWPWRTSSQVPPLIGQSFCFSASVHRRRLAELLQPLRVNVVGVRQKPRGNEPIPVHPVSELEKLLPPPVTCKHSPGQFRHEALHELRTFHRHEAPRDLLQHRPRATVDQDALMKSLHAAIRRRRSQRYRPRAASARLSALANAELFHHSPHGRRTL